MGSDPIEDEPPDHWAAWSRRLTALVGEATALSCDLDPDKSNISLWIRATVRRLMGIAEVTDIFYLPKAETDPVIERRLTDFTTRMDVVADHVNHRSLGTSNGKLDGVVKLVDFAQWAAGLTPPFRLPPLFPGAIKKPSVPAKASAERWPWGDYENTLLGHLAEAVQYFWAHEEDRRSPALKEEVVGWLVGRGISQGKAEAIALVIRPDDIAPGPRKKDEE